MRLGQVEKKVLKVLYDEEQKRKQQKEKYFIHYGLRPRQIVSQLVKIKFPSEKRFNLSKKKKDFYLMWLASVVSLPKKDKEYTLSKDPMKKIYENIKEERKKWNRKTNAIFRAIKQLCKKLLIVQEYDRSKKKYISRYNLLETGRRIISHRKV